MEKKMEGDKKQGFYSVEVLSLIVAALALLLSIFLSYRDGQLAKQYLTLDMQEKRPFLAPTMTSEELADGKRRRWSWLATNTGTVVAKLIFFDYRQRGNFNDDWNGSGNAHNEIVYPGESLQLIGATGELSGISVSCIVFEDITESGEKRRWVGYAQYFCTHLLEKVTKSNIEPKMLLVHRMEKQIDDHNITTCNAIEWWQEIPSVKND